MGAIVSRKRRTPIVSSQPIAVLDSQTAAHDATTTSPSGNQASTTPDEVSSRGEDDNVEGADQGDDKLENREGKNRSQQSLERSTSASSAESKKSSSSLETTDANQEINVSASEEEDGEKSERNSKRTASASSAVSKKSRCSSKCRDVNTSFDQDTLSDEEFNKAWRKALLEDLDIAITDNVKIVRIFTSSTFTDTFVERNTLMERVYPRLKSYCQERGYDFQIVDMRWGVRDESTDDHMTTELCMRELRACQELSTGPNFITFLGQKYGYRPFPAKISATEFESLLEAVDNRDDHQLLTEWFCKDDNAVPSQYLLQPITSRLPQYRDPENEEARKKASADWWTTFERMQIVLRTAADKVFDEDERLKYHMSVTEDEIRRGIIAVSSPENHCFWFKRVITDLIQNTDDRNAGKFVDKMYGETNSLDESAQNLLSNLREKDLPTALPATNVIQYDVKWTSEGISPRASTEHAEYLEKLCSDVYNVLTRMIHEAIKNKESGDGKDLIAEEVLQHALFCKRKGLACQGRDDFLKEVRQSMLENEKHRVVVLHGESGCGKTSIMAKIAVEIPKWLESDSVIVLLRFIGTSPQSSNIRLLVRSLCEQLYTITENDTSEIPEDLMELWEFFPKCLACTSRHVVLILDSLDQLPSEDGGRRLEWLPRNLPDNVFLVLSRIRSDIGDYLIERGADDARVVYWYHRQFIEVATHRYLGLNKEEIHSKLAEFFSGKWANGAAKPYVDKEGHTLLKDRLVSAQPLVFHSEDAQGTIFNLRKLNELPFHLLHSGDRKRLKEMTLCNFEFLLTKLRATSTESILDDIGASLLLYPDDEDFISLQKTVQLSSFALKADPNQLAAQLLGRLMGEGDSVESGGIKDLLQQAYSSSVPCLIPNDKCLTSPGGPLVSLIKLSGDFISQCCGFSCDGKTAFIAMSSSSFQLQVLVVNLKNGKTLQRITIPESEDVGIVLSVQGGSLKPDLLLLAGSADICLLNTSTSQITHRFAALAHESQYLPIPPVSLVDSDSRIVAITDENLKIWTVDDGRLAYEIDVGKINTDEEYGALGVSGVLAAFCVHLSKRFKVLNCKTGEELREVSAFSKAETCFIAEIKVTSKDQVIVTSTERNNLRLYNIHSGDLIREVSQFRINSGLVRLQVTEDGTRAVGISDYEILITDLENGSVYKTLKSASFGTLIIHQKFFTRDGKIGISFAHDETVRIYDLEKAMKEKKKDIGSTSKDHKAVSSVDSITYLIRGSDDRHVIATAQTNDSNEVIVWDIEASSKVRALKLPMEGPSPSTIRMYGTDYAVGYIHDQKFLHFQVYNLKTGKIERCLQGKASKRTEAFGFVDKNHVIAFSRGRRNLKVWNIKDGKLVKQFKFGQKHRLEDMLVSRNGEAVVCSQVGQTVDHDEENTIPLIFLNPKSGEQKILEEKGARLLLWKGSIGENGSYLLCLTNDYSAILWDLTSGRRKHWLKAEGEDPTVLVTAISAVRNVALTGQGDGGIFVWDIASGCLQYKFDCLDVDSLFIARDGQMAFSNYRSSNRNIDAWDLNAGSKVASFTSDWKPERLVASGNCLVIAKADRPELMSLHPHLPEHTENALQEDSPFKGCKIEGLLEQSEEFALGREEDEDEDADDDSDKTDIQKTELTKKAVYASPNIIIGGGSSVFASKNIFFSGNVTINGVPIQDL
ncbi:PREDICTED: uncharacterized protein LOC107340178 [Acropora digitifera]|uniref:uncharacterized protein LOC107340178 n=1 Tax=Acropora digitifera TaxID=70779 RepID=UPI00077AB391|nr:PREDICTED: uncharacterized protein LOC107340178 [Acropora digitifera]